MRALTLTQPWATLIAIGAKKVETRSWPTAYRGPLAIHAAKGFPGWAKAYIYDDRFVHVLQAAGFTHWKQLPLGMVLCTCRLVGTFRTERGAQATLLADPLSEQERAFGDYTPGRWAWNLADVQPFASPIPATGALGLWEWEP